MSSSPRIETLGQLKAAIARGEIRRRPVRDEVRENLSERLRKKDTLFPGIIGYDDTVIPQLVNAVLARHHFILLGLRGQAKTRILRALTTLLDEWLPVIPESEINDDPIAPLSAFGQNRVKAEGDQMPIRWLPREARYVEKLATPDVTIADMIGDIDPIKAAKGGLQLGSELSMHFGLLPRANRGIFAINELPDLAGKIQVGLFNILQEGDVQIKGYPVRLPLDVLIAFTANPEDYTARGKIITPLKDRIGAEIRTHYMQQPRRRAEHHRTGSVGVARQRRSTCRGSCARWSRRSRSRRATSARSTSARASASACRSACSKPSISNAERRALANGESPVVPRVTDVYAALPSMTGKFELEYEGELKGADQVGARPGARGGRQRVRRLLRRCRHQADHRMVRPRRLAEPVGHDRRRDAGEGRGGRAGTGRSRDVTRRHRSRRPGAGRRGRRSISCSKGCIRRRRSAAATCAATTAPNRLRRPQPQQPRTAVLTPDDDEDEIRAAAAKKKKYYN